MSSVSDTRRWKRYRRICHTLLVAPFQPNTLLNTSLGTQVVSSPTQSRRICWPSCPAGHSPNRGWCSIEEIWKRSSSESTMIMQSAGSGFAVIQLIESQLGILGVPADARRNNENHQVFRRGVFGQVEMRKGIKQWSGCVACGPLLPFQRICCS